MGTLTPRHGDWINSAKEVYLPTRLLRFPTAGTVLSLHLVPGLLLTVHSNKDMCVGAPNRISSGGQAPRSAPLVRK